MKKPIASFIIATLLIFSIHVPAASASVQTGGDLLTALEYGQGDMSSLTDIQIADAMMAFGIVVGVVGYHQTLMDLEADIDGLSYDPAFCLPKKSNLGQHVKVIIKHLNNNPEILHINAVPMITSAFLVSYPCK